MVLTDEIQNWEEVKETARGDLCLTFNTPGQNSQADISNFAERTFTIELEKDPTYDGHDNTLEAKTNLDAIQSLFENDGHKGPDGA